MNSIIPEGSVLIRSLGWTLMHSLWQGALIAACLWVSLKLLHNIAARIKYHLSLLSLTALASWFVVTWIQQWQRLQAITVHVTAATRDTGVEHSYTISSLPAEGNTEIWMRHLLPNMEHAFPVLVLVYMVGLALMILRFGFGIGRLLQTRYTGILPADAYWMERLSQLKDKLVITRKVQLFYSSRINMPMMLGIFKPIILLPIATIAQLNVDQVEAILLHELAHIKRQDYLVNMLQIVVETGLFFNPFMWWISAGIRREREHCCDDLVLAQTQQPLPYATALATLEASRNAAQPLTLAAGGQRHFLFNRIKRMTEMKKNPLNYGRLAAALVIVGAITFSVVWFSPAFAQNRKSKTAATTSTTQHIVIIDDKGNRREYNSFDELPEAEKKQMRKTLAEAAGSHHDEEAWANGVAPVYDAPEPAEAPEPVEDVVAPEPPIPPVPGRAGMAPIAPVPAMPSMNNVAPMPPMPPMPPMNSASARRALAEANKALAAVDWKAIDKTTQEALKNADKAIAEANIALKNVDWSSVDRQMDEAMKQIDAVNWDEVAKADGSGKTGRDYSREVHREMANARREASREMARAREDAMREAAGARREAADERRRMSDERRREMDQRREELDQEKRERQPGSSSNTRKDVRTWADDKEGDDAVSLSHNGNAVMISGSGSRMGVVSNNVGGKRTIEGMNDFEGMVREMKADGIISDKDNVAISKTPSELYVNGKRQPDAVVVKYRHYFPKGTLKIATSRNSTSYSYDL